MAAAEQIHSPLAAIWKACPGIFHHYVDLDLREMETLILNLESKKFRQIRLILWGLKWCQVDEVDDVDGGCSDDGVDDEEDAVDDALVSRAESFAVNDFYAFSFKFMYMISIYAIS